MFHCKIDCYLCVFSNISLYVVVFFFSFSGLLLVPYGLMYSASTLRVAYCFNDNMYICEELNDDDDNINLHYLKEISTISAEITLSSLISLGAFLNLSQITDVT